MSPSNEEPDYPPMLYEVGEVPLPGHSMNHNCYFSKLSIVRDSLGEEVWSFLKESSVGVILKLAEMKFVFSSKTVHQFLSSQLRTMKPHEIWSVIGGQPIRFSLHEFSEITGMNCHPFDEEDTVDVNHGDFWDEMGVSRILGPCWDELLDVLARCTTWSFNKKKMVGLLCVLSIAIYGIHKTSRIPLDAAKRVFDYEAFERFPWGRVACQRLIEGVKVLTFEKDSYLVKGFVHVLLIWVYESVHVLGERFGKRRAEMQDVPLLRWVGSRDRFKLPEVLDKEMEEHGKVRVRNMITKPVAEIYPQWDDDVEDHKLDILIRDILEN